MDGGRKIEEKKNLEAGCLDNEFLYWPDISGTDQLLYGGPFPYMDYRFAGRCRCSLRLLYRLRHQTAKPAESRDMLPELLK
ncbi:hypothetical protein Ami103574_05160 [Aminipila butyrica]|uniref:Uncharacterized protein n=1 Tax=Aminipila butyrica TaxID=433296 RepID=A0A858BXF1_9FIRM|nr:hypothetical protein [Aminipila butyrica]QIB68746.1 hypothetical protein Ami103574_05160 [Aminipila butyrica]